MAKVLAGGPKVWIFAAAPAEMDAELNDTTIQKMAAENPTCTIINGTFFNPKGARETYGVVLNRAGQARGLDRPAGRYWFGVRNGTPAVAAIGGPNTPANYKSNYVMLLSGLGILIRNKKPDSFTSDFAKYYRGQRKRPAIGIREVDGKQEVIIYVNPTCYLCSIYSRIQDFEDKHATLGRKFAKNGLKA